VDPLDGALEPERSPLVQDVDRFPDSWSCRGQNLLHISLREGPGRWVRGSVWDKARSGSMAVGDGRPDVSGRAAHSERGIAEKGPTVFPSEPGRHAAHSGLTTLRHPFLGRPPPAPDPARPRPDDDDA
jgi:hypothetical protein